MSSTTWHVSLFLGSIHAVDVKMGLSLYGVSLPEYFLTESAGTERMARMKKKKEERQREAVRKTERSSEKDREKQ